jgi:hypothetical protein
METEEVGAYPLAPQGRESEGNTQQPASEGMEQGDTAREPKDEEGDDESSEPEAVASPIDLLEHLSRMMSSLERTWSEALDTESAAQAREEAAGVWQSFVAAQSKWLEQVGTIGERLGVQQTIDRFPLDDAGLAKLELDPADIARRYHQLEIASLYASTSLVDSLKGLNNPTGQRIDLLAGRVTETWWEAGAFSLVRRRATSLARILREQHACLQVLADQSHEAESIPGGGISSPPSWMESLQAASDLISHGRHVPALPQLLLGIKSVLAKAAGVSADELPVPLGPSLASIPQLSSLEAPISLLEIASRRSGEGKEVDPGVAVPLSEELSRRIQELAMNPPSREALSTLWSTEGG